MRAAPAEPEIGGPVETPAPQPPEVLASLIREFAAKYPEAAVLEDGKAIFELASAEHTVATEHGRCTLHLWNAERNLVRSVVGATQREASLLLSTRRFGHAQTKLLHLQAEAQRRTPARREPARKQHQRLLERVLARAFAEWQPASFRTAMDLERSFGPAYTRGSMVRGKEAWAVIGVGAAESQAVIDGVLSLGILWLHHCRERADGKRLYKGLRVVVPRGAGTLTLARLPWLNAAAAQWEIYELDELSEELTERDPADQGNLRTRLAHLPDEAAALERFAGAIAQVMELVPAGEEPRVEQRLRSSAELGFLLHGLEFARAHLTLAPGSFRYVLEITAGNGRAQTLLTTDSQAEIREHIAELFRRRDARAVEPTRRLRPGSSARMIGAYTGKPAHARLGAQSNAGPQGMDRLQQRNSGPSGHADPLFRAAPERWLESALRENLSPLTRSLAPVPEDFQRARTERFANDDDPDTRGNRLDPNEASRGRAAQAWVREHILVRGEQVIPHFDPRFVYAQVPAIAGASDRGMLDLLGLTADGRLAVIELKASDDLQFALQGLDYWVRVRHHLGQATDDRTGTALGLSDLQRHGYFRGVELSTLPPRLFLVAPALHVHPATEVILRYLSPQVQWALVALNEQWRQAIRVVWRKSGGTAGSSSAPPQL